MTMPHSKHYQLLPVLLLKLLHLLQVSIAQIYKKILKWKPHSIIWTQISSHLMHHRFCLALIISAFTSVILAYYLDQERDPITRRKKHILFSDGIMKKVCEMSVQKVLLKNEDKVLPCHHADYRRIWKVQRQLVLTNRMMEGMTGRAWKLVVINRRDVMDSFSLSDGTLVVYTGMLQLITNDDQLALMIAHEMSHTILRHSAEKLTRGLGLSILWIVPSILSSKFLPSLLDISASHLASILLTLPFSRTMEQEADIMGLQMAARGCYDVREVGVFWGRILLTRNPAPPAWSESHPDHEHRFHELSQWVPKALELFLDSACPARLETASE